MKKISLFLATVLLIAGAGGTYGYFFIYNEDNETDSTAVETEEELEKIYNF